MSAPSSATLAPRRRAPWTTPTRARERLSTLLFAPASPVPLAVLRILLAAILLGQAALLVREMLELYGPNGLVQSDLRRFMLTPTLPFFLDWSAVAGWVHVGAETLIRGLFLVYVGALSLLLLGLFTRLAAVVAWVTHLLLTLNLGFSSSYGVDTFAHIFLFYFTWMPVNRALSLDKRLGFVAGEAPAFQRLSLRIVQLHLFIIYMSTGIDKVIGWQWQTGEVMWRAWMLPQFAVFDMSWIAWHPWLTKVAAWSALFFEIGYPVLLCWPKTRKLGAYGIIGMHAGIALLMGLWSFSAVMAALTACAFLIPARPERRPRASSAAESRPSRLAAGCAARPADPGFASPLA